MPEHVPVTFVPAQRSVEVLPGTTVLQAAAQAGIVIPAPCGGRGACGRCAIKVADGDLAAPSPEEAAALARARVTPDAGLRLACMATVAAAVTVQTMGAGVQPSVTASGSAPLATLVAGVDLGTTSVAVNLLDARTGTLVAAARVPNMQARYGADVLSRISAALAGDAESLAADAAESFAHGLESALQCAGADATRLERIAVAGNTAMISLLTGSDVSGLAAHPFSHSLGDLTHDRGLSGPAAERFGTTEVLVVPPVAAFVGGDLVAGMLAEGLADGAPGTLFIDVGTNAEVAGIAADRIVVASAPAGPAFEGWGIACGGHAGEGGVVAVEYSTATGLVPVFEGGHPTHITGSGLVSVVALLRRLGHLDPDGVLLPTGPAEARFFDARGVAALSLAPDPHDRSVFLTQLDVRAFQSAKAAVCVAVQAVAEACCLTSAGLSEIVVAGAFGGALSAGDLVELGVVPSVGERAIRMAPDAAVRGAAAIALEPKLLEDARALVRRASHLDLATGTRFAADFLACLRLEPYGLAGG